MSGNGGIPRSWTFTVPGVPRTKRGAGKGAHGQMHASRETEAYEMRIAGAAVSAGLAAGRGPCRVEVGVVLPNRRVKDDDRIKSAVNDGLKRAGRAALHDDNICIIQESRVYLIGIDPGAPCVVITVTMLDVDRSLTPTRNGAPAPVPRRVELDGAFPGDA